MYFQSPLGLTRAEVTFYCRKIPEEEILAKELARFVALIDKSLIYSTPLENQWKAFCNNLQNSVINTRFCYYVSYWHFKSFLPFCRNDAVPGSSVWRQRCTVPSRKWRILSKLWPWTLSTILSIPCYRWMSRSSNSLPKADPEQFQPHPIPDKLALPHDWMTNTKASGQARLCGNTQRRMWRTLQMP